MIETIYYLLIFVAFITFLFLFGYILHTKGTKMIKTMQNDIFHCSHRDFFYFVDNNITKRKCRQCLHIEEWIDGEWIESLKDILKHESDVR